MYVACTKEICRCLKIFKGDYGGYLGCDINVIVVGV